MSHETEHRTIETPSAHKVHTIVDPEKAGPERKKPGRAKTVGTALGGLGVLAAGAAAFMIPNWNHDTPAEPTPEPTPTPTAEAPATPGETPAETAEPTAEPSPTDLPEVTPPTTEDLEVLANSLDREQFFELFTISAEEFTTPEAITERYVALLELLMNSGGSVQFDWDLITNEEKTKNDIMATFDQRIMDSLFLNGASGYAENITNNIRPNVIRDSYWSVGESEVPYAVNFEAQDFKLVEGTPEDGSFDVSIIFHETDNGGDTIADYRKTYDMPLYRDMTATHELSFVNSNGSWKLDKIHSSDIQDNSHN